MEDGGRFCIAFFRATADAQASAILIAPPVVHVSGATV